MDLIKLSPQIQYLPATNNPLSANVGIVHGKEFDWIFDVGSSQDAVNTIEQITKKKNIILSHFHKDHTQNMERISYNNLYCGDYTQKKWKNGTAIAGSLTIQDGVKLTIFSLPSPHAKGSIGLEVNGEYAFLGDAIYSGYAKGKAAYNVNVLKEMITRLECLSANTFLISHDPEFARPKEVVIEQLKDIYNTRKPGESYIKVGV